MIIIQVNQNYETLVAMSKGPQRPRKRSNFIQQCTQIFD